MRAHRLAIALVALAVIIVDQLTKWWALETLATRTIDVVWTLRFNLAFNTGTAFSLGGGYGSIIAVLALGVVGYLIWQGRQVASWLGAVSVGLIVGGALGNLIDRVFRGDGGFLSGAVVDFIDLQWWPIFNIADAAIVVGGLLLVLQTLRQPAES